MSLTAAALDSRTQPRLNHLRAIMSDAGVVQFCRGRNPDISSGTCLDDNARVWLVAMQALMADSDHPFARDIGDTAVRFVLRARREDGFLHNLADIRGSFIDEVGSEDSIGRAVWACGTASRYAAVPAWRSAAIETLEAALPAIQTLSANHARAYSVLGLAAAVAPGPHAVPAALNDRVNRTLATVCDALNRDFHAYASDEWSWWTEALTWANGRLPEAMLRAAAATGDKRYAATGFRALEFLAAITQPESVFIPIGNDEWYVKGGRRARYDQQPIEACAMVDAWLAAYRLTGNATYLERARVAFEWFNGLNTERIVVAVAQTGGCHDGLMRGRVNLNQGAESTLSYLHAHYAIDAAESE